MLASGNQIDQKPEFDEISFEENYDD